MEIYITIAWLFCVLAGLSFAFWGWFTATREYYDVSKVICVFCALLYIIFR